MTAANRPTQDPPTFPSIEVNTCPFAFYAETRETTPVRDVTRPGARPEFLVSRYEDVVYVTRHPKLFGNDLDEILPPKDSSVLAPPGRNLKYDPRPPHRINPDRQLAIRPFALSRLRGYEPAIVAVADELIDGFAARGECSFIDEFAAPLPIDVISDMLGISREHRNRVRGWAGGLVGSARRHIPAGSQSHAQHYRRNEELRTFLTAELEARRAEPREDILSELIAAQRERDGTFDLPLVRHMAAFLLLGGAKTSGHMIASGLVLLLQHPDILAGLDPTDRRAMEQLVEEILRLESPVQTQPRLARIDTELAGTQIPAGSVILMGLGSANRDTTTFEHSDTFDPTRKNANAQLAFSVGIHFCLGAPLARLEGRIAFERLLTRLTDIQLDPDRSDLTNIDSMNFRGPTRVHITFEAS
jgi:cytochrome P450